MESTLQAKRFLLSCPALAELPHFKRNAKAAAALLSMLERMEKANKEVSWNLQFAKLCACILSGDTSKQHEFINGVLKEKKLRSYAKVFKPLISLSQSMAGNQLGQAYASLAILEEQSVLTSDERALLLVCKQYMASKLLLLLVCACKGFKSKIVPDHFYRLGFEDLAMASQIVPYFNPGVLSEISQKQSEEKWITVNREAADVFVEQYNPELLNEETLKQVGIHSLLDQLEGDIELRWQLNEKYLKRRSSRCLDTFVEPPEDLHKKRV